MSKMGKSKSDNFIYEIHNSEFVITSGEYHWWMFRKQKRFGEFGRNWKLLHLEGVLVICEKSAATWKISKMWRILKKKRDSSTSEGQEREMDHLQCRIKKLKKEIEKGEFE